MLETLRKMMAAGLLLLSSGCVLPLPWTDVDSQIKAVEANHTVGCSYIIGGGNPPASRIDGGHIGCYGMGMTPEIGKAYLDQLKSMK